MSTKMKTVRFIMANEDKTKQGLVTHGMDICYFRKKRMPSMSTMTKRGVEAANENDYKRSLIFWSV